MIRQRHSAVGAADKGCSFQRNRWTLRLRHGQACCPHWLSSWRCSRICPADRHQRCLWAQPRQLTKHWRASGRAPDESYSRGSAKRQSFENAPESSVIWRASAHPLGWGPSLWTSFSPMIIVCTARTNDTFCGPDPVVVENKIRWRPDPLASGPSAGNAARQVPILGCLTLAWRCRISSTRTLDACRLHAGSRGYAPKAWRLRLRHKVAKVTLNSYLV